VQVRGVRPAYFVVEQRLLHRNRHGAQFIAHLFELQPDRAGAVGGEHVVGIGECARSQAQATAAYAVGEIVAQPLQVQDPVIEVGAPASGQPGPVPAGRNPIGGQCGQRCTDTGQRNAQPVRHPDEGNPPQGVAAVAALVARRAAAGDQSLPLVEVQSRDRHAGPMGEFAGKQLLAVHNLNNTSGDGPRYRARCE